MRIELEDEKKEEDKKALVEDSLDYRSLNFRQKIAFKRRKYKETTSNMTFKGKLKYIFTLYRFELIVGIVLVVTAIMVGRLAYRASLPNVLHIAVINQYFDTSDISDYIKESYRDYLDIGDKNVITVYKNMYVRRDEDPDVVGLALTDYQALGHYNLKDMLDVIICDSEALEVYSWSDDTTAIDVALGKDLYEQVKDHGVVLKDKSNVKNEGKEYIGALDITDTEFVKNSQITYSPVYLLIPSTKVEDNKETIDFIKMVYGL